MTDMPTFPASPGSVPGFAGPGRLKGRIVLPDDVRYETARLVANAAIDPHPAAIILARNVEDVVATLRLADGIGMPLAVRAGGHSTVGYSAPDGAIVLDLAGLDKIEIDAAKGTAWVGAGVTAGALTATAHAEGYAVSFGDTGRVGIAGLTLGGGIGWLVRKNGLTIDSLLEAELVLATGEEVVASPTDHADLFWALRGGGGNFGVATRLRFQLRAVDMVLAGDVIVLATPDVLGQLIEVLADAPDGLTVMPTIMRAPPMPELPEGWHGRLVVFLSFCHAGPVEEDERVLEILRSFGESVVLGLERMPYPSMFPPPSEDQTPYTTGTLFVDDLDEAAIRIIEHRMADSSAEGAIIQLRVLGGAVSRVANEATAFGHRNRRAAVWLITDYPTLEEKAYHEAWTADFEAELVGAGCGSGAYVNFLGREGETELRAAYPPKTLARLVEVKRRYDPDNLFRSNLNIPPNLEVEAG